MFTILTYISIALELGGAFVAPHIHSLMGCFAQQCYINVLTLPVWCCCWLPGGLALVTGGVNCGTWMLLSIIVPVTAIMHWPITPSGDMDQNQFVNLLKNIAIIGGLIAIRSAYGCGGAKAVVKDKLR